MTAQQTPTNAPIVICGPTASGKSGLAMRLAKHTGGEIIGADSVQIYKRLDIGSAKASAADRAAVPHHLVDAIALDRPYDAGDYVKDATAAIADIQARGLRPIICGGTGMYIRALLYGLVESPPSDKALRDTLGQRAQQEGLAALHAELTEVDPVSAARIHPNDAVRIVRALEVYQLTGKPISDLHKAHSIKTQPARFGAWQMALAPQREALYERINTRVDQMFEAGWRQEVQSILDDGHSPDLKPLGSLGYRHLVSFLRGDDQGPLAWTQTVSLIKRDHRRYAKRQRTWLRSQPHLHWFDNPQAAFEAAVKHIENPSPQPTESCP